MSFRPNFAKLFIFEYTSKPFFVVPITPPTKYKHNRRKIDVPNNGKLLTSRVTQKNLKIKMYTCRYRYKAGKITSYTKYLFFPRKFFMQTQTVRLLYE